MAKTDATPTFEFGTFEKPAKVNPYADVVKQLAEAAVENPAVSVTFAVDAHRAQNEETKFRKAANEIDRTAKLVNKDESGVTVAGKDEDGNDVLTGQVKLTFMIGKRHKARRGAGVVAEASEAAE